MLDTNYSVDILINGKPIRKIPFNGQLFVEARPNQEYSIRIKNNTINRILAVTSVDGLDVLTGEQAEETGNGYVINGYNSLHLDGFRISDEKVAKFVFDHKDSSYAASKKDGSERNVGVIGIRLFQEKIKPQPITIREEHHHHHDYWHQPWNTPIYPRYPTIWGDGLLRDGDMTFNSSIQNDGNNLLSIGDHVDYCGSNDPVNNDLSSRKLSPNSVIRSLNDVDPGGFDLGTKFGKSKESHVVEVEFERGVITFTTNIYYASRQSLLAMGVPLTSEKQVSFPEPFANKKYAIPPKGWQS